MSLEAADTHMVRARDESKQPLTAPPAQHKLFEAQSRRARHFRDCFRLNFSHILRPALLLLQVNRPPIVLARALARVLFPSLSH